MLLKFLALVFAVLVLAKLIMLVVARDYWLGLVEKMFRPGNRTTAIYGGAAALVGVLVLSQVRHNRGGGGDAVDVPADGAGDGAVWRDDAEVER